MRHLSIVFIFLSILGYGQSSLRFQETVHRFGELIENEKVSYTFTFLNEGIDSVRITSVKASCDCVMTTYNREKIAPNATDSMPDFTGTTNRQRMLTVVSMAGAGVSEPDLSFLTSSAYLRPGAGLEPPYAVILPSSSATKPSKRWPVENYIRLAGALKDKGWQPVLTGTELDRPITSKIAAACRGCLDLTGKPNLFLLAELALGSSIVIGNDTGPVFLAARLNVPTLMLMGADTDASMSAPYGEKARWIQKGRLDQLSFEDVWKTVELTLE